jgi:serine/threonine protein kinase
LLALQGGSLHARLYSPSRSSSGGAALSALSRGSSGGVAPPVPAGALATTGGSGPLSAGGGRRSSRHGPPAPLPLREALVIAADVAAAMSYLHTATEGKPVVVHRDLVRCARRCPACSGCLRGW